MPFVPIVVAGNGGASAAVCPHGGHVVSWQAGGRERLFLSPAARFAAGSAIRGGVPVVFPQFAERGPGPRHGFARLLPWQPARASEASRITLRLRESRGTLSMWPHPFRTELTVQVGGDSLAMQLAVHNPGTAAFHFTCALHTYLAVSNIEEVRLTGLRGVDFVNSAAGGRKERQDDASLSFVGEVDRIYRGLHAPVRLADRNGQVDIASAGFAETVVWNPGAALAARIEDLGEGQHARFVCVEAACALTPVTLAPGETWSGVQTLRCL